MTVYNLSTSLHRFVNERSADLFDGSRPCGFHCEVHPGSLPHITGFSPGITRTPCRKFNKEEKIEVLGSIRVHFLTHDLGRPIELLMFYCSF